MNRRPPSQRAASAPIPWEDLPEELPSDRPTWVVCVVGHGHPSNRLSMERSVDGRPISPFTAWPEQGALRSDSQGRYLSLLLPLETGRTAAFTPMLTRSGLVIERLPTRVVRYGPGGPTGSEPSAPPAPPAVPREPESAEGLPRFQWASDFLGAFTAQLAQPPESFGTTSEGLRITWYIASGEIRGPRLNAKIRGEGGDWMVVRRDGVGMADVRITYETDDGALLLSCYYGTFDLGKDGYERALRKNYNPCPPLVLSPRFITSHPKWIWLNRLQCIAVGRVAMDTLKVRFDLYAVRVGHALHDSGLELSCPPSGEEGFLQGKPYYDDSLGTCQRS